MLRLVQDATVRRFVLPLAALLFLQGALFGQEITPALRIRKISERNSLDGTGLMPWYLKINYQLFDGAGKPSSTGVVEEWWKEHGEWRVTVTESGSTKTFVHTAGGDYRSHDAQSMPTRVQLLLEHIVHPVEEDGLLEATPRAYPHDFGKQKMTCIMLEQQVKASIPTPLGVFPTYCASDENVLRVSWLSSHLSIINNRMGSFAGHNLGMQVSILAGQTPLIEGTVETLHSIPAAQVDLATAGLDAGGNAPHPVDQGIAAGQVMRKVPPIYPEVAKEHNVEGTVILRAIIGTDGRIRSLRIQKSPDGDLSLAAFYAVAQWTYTPYLLNGVPSEVDTTITVNFRMH